MTQAVRVLRAADVKFDSHPYTYVEGGGTGQFARELGVDEHSVIKTLIMEDDQGAPLIVLMYGDRQVSTRQLARQIGVKQVRPCEPKVADRQSGYQVGGTSPFGTRKQLPVYMEKSIEDLETIYINGGKRGFLIGLSPQTLVEILKPIPVQVGIKPTASRPQKKS